MSNKANCATCGEKPQSDNAHRKIYINNDCDKYGVTYLYQEWIDSHTNKNKEAKWWK